jgi:transposase
MLHQDGGYGLGERAGSVPRVGATARRQGRDDLLFLEALHYFSVHNITQRALPERFGKWNSVWKRFDRLSKAGVFETFFDHLAALSSSAHLVQMFDSTAVRAHVSAAGAKGAGKSGARSLARRLLDRNPPEDGFRQVSHLLRPDRRREVDAPHFPIPARLGPDIDPRAVIGDNGYASKANRQAAWDRGAIPAAQHQRKGPAGLLRKGAMQGSRPHRPRSNDDWRSAGNILWRPTIHSRYETL